MEEDVTYSPKRVVPHKRGKDEEGEEKKKKKEQSASDRIFPDSRYGSLFRRQDEDYDQDEDEEEEGIELKDASDVLREARASAKQTSRLVGNVIEYEETWKKFQNRPAREIIASDFHPLEPGYIGSEEQLAMADTAKAADLVIWKRKNKILNDKFRQFINKIIGLAHLRPEDVYNAPPDDVRTTFDVPEVLGLESIAESVSSHISDAFTMVNLRSGTVLAKVEDIVFSDDGDLVNLFARLVWIRMTTSSYFNGLRPTLESKLKHLREQEHFLLIAIGQRLSGADSADASSFPRTPVGFKKPRITLT